MDSATSRLKLLQTFLLFSSRFFGFIFFVIPCSVVIIVVVEVVVDVVDVVVAVFEVDFRNVLFCSLGNYFFEFLKHQADVVLGKFSFSAWRRL